MGFGDASNGKHTWTLDEKHSCEIVKKVLDEGINFFDAAIGYKNGIRKQYLGRVLRDFAKREEFVVATKFLPHSKEAIEKGVTAQQHIEMQLNDSLHHLGMDYVDLYIYHMWYYPTPLYDIMAG